MSRIAVIGAGVAGLRIATALSDANDVRVFEKSRGVGGRVATRHAGDWHFDHGAQFFTARTAAFQAFLKPLIAAGVVAHWPARFVEIRADAITARRNWTPDYPHYVGTPHMNALGKHLADGVDVRTGVPVDALDRAAGGWVLRAAGSAIDETFDWVVVTAPAAQAASLLPAESPLSSVAARKRMKSCFALMLGFDDLPDPGFDAALVRERDISWVSVNSRKPGRPGGTSIVVHASNAWADANLERPLDDIREHLLAELQAATGIDTERAAHADVQRWRYANIDKQDDSGLQVDAERRLAIAGDWLIRGRVESAFTSAERLLDALAPLLPA